MKTVLFFLAISLFINHHICAQNLNDMPDQHTETNLYDSLNIDDYITDSDCYDLNIVPTVSHPDAVIGHPNILDTEYQDTRENMTVTLKINYAGFNMGVHPDDEIWVYDEEDRLVEKNVAYDDPFNPGEHLFFLNVRGNFSTYNTRIVYYNGTYNCTIEYADALEYNYNNVVGTPLEPFIIDPAPIIFELNNTTLTAEIVSEDYAGDFCLDITATDCDGVDIGTDQVCYEVGLPPCPDHLSVEQLLIDQYTTHT